MVLLVSRLRLRQLLQNQPLQNPPLQNLPLREQYLQTVMTNGTLLLCPVILVHTRVRLNCHTQHKRSMQLLHVTVHSMHM